LEEDLGHGCITTRYLHLQRTPKVAFLIAKENGIVAGLDIAKQVFQLVDEQTRFVAYKKDGDFVEKGTELAKIEGEASALLQGERVALNFLQRMSGIATKTKQFVNAIQPHHAKLLDTRKTTPMLRTFEKMAVRTGGGYNHRFGLFDMIMLKENHIRSAGSITNAVSRVKASNTAYKIEVEVTNLEEAQEAFDAGVDRIMLDNMSIEDMRTAVSKYKGRVELEASGNVTLDSIQEIASTGVDYISSGALTHSYKSLDISLLFKE
jgi:nicotinate-nucleotide pyrophosphorylase (carboxylating)